MATLRDIAMEVGVSIRTVSRALSGDGYVRTDVRDRITSVADRLGYRPDPVAQSLRLGRTREIVVVSSSVDELHMAKIASLERSVRPSGHTVSVMMAQERGERPDALVEEIVARKPAGVAVIGLPGYPVASVVEPLLAGGVPCIGVDAAGEWPAVVIDRPAGVAEATRYLVERHRRHIVYVGPADSSNRIDGFARVLHEVDREPVVFDPGPGRTPIGMVQRLLAAHPHVDAIQAYSDEWALELLAGLHAAGVRIPDDVAVVGFDDRWAAAYSWPPLTTVAQPGEEIGQAAAELLLHPEAGELDSHARRVIPTRLVVRESA